MAEKQPGITKVMKFGDEEFEVPFAKGNPGKSREELDEIKRKLRESGDASDGEMVATMGFCAKYQHDRTTRRHVRARPGLRPA